MPTIIETKEPTVALRFTETTRIQGQAPVPEIDCETRYELRGIKRDFEQFQGSWLDADVSGDYDPTGKAVIPTFIPIIKRLRQFYIPFRQRSSGEQPPKFPSLQAARNQGYTLPVKMNLKEKISEGAWSTEIGKSVQQQLANVKAHYWPEERPNHDITELSAQDIQPRKLRSRTRAASLPANSSGNGRSWTEVSLGHPEYRGCKACYDIGMQCSLVKGHKYPCLICTEEGEECEVIAEPPQKRSCGSCTRRRLVCSFQEPDNHRGPCRNCRDNKRKCIAGPKSGYTRVGPCLDEVWEFLLGMGHVKPSTSGQSRPGDGDSTS